jgi:tetratricopeptide (TPR) repeat protein
MQETARESRRITFTLLLFGIVTFGIGLLLLPFPLAAWRLKRPKLLPSLRTICTGVSFYALILLFVNSPYILVEFERFIRGGESRWWSMILSIALPSIIIIFSRLHILKINYIINYLRNIDVQFNIKVTPHKRLAGGLADIAACIAAILLLTTTTLISYLAVSLQEQQPSLEAEAAAYFDEGTSYWIEQPSKAENAFRQAMKRFESLADGRPDYPDHQIDLASCHVNLGMIAGKDGRTSTAISEFEKAVKILEVMAPGLSNNQRLQEHLALARRHLAIILVTRADPTRRDPDQAVSLARQITESLPRDVESWRFLAWVSINAGSIPTAIDALEQAMRLRNGGDSHEWFPLSAAHSLKGDRV